MLQHKPDGSYEYRGLMLKAVIQPDGQLRFLDRSAQNKGLGVAFELFDWLERLHHNDLRRSQRRWLLERTAALRETLADAGRRERAQLHGDTLRHALALIWSDAKLSLPRRKQETLRLWDAQPAEAAESRALILSFVRERCPRSSECAFQATELQEFNKGRKGTAFVP